MYKTVRSKNNMRKIKPTFMIYANFESILVPENNVKQNPGESYKNKYQNHVGCSSHYILVCVDDQFTKLLS